MVIAGTGHRPDKIGGYSPEAGNKRISLALRVISFLKPSRVISGMALGWDQDLASAAVALNVPLTAAIPFEGQENRWPEESRSKYKKLYESADTKIVLSKSFSNYAYQLRNIWMVDNCDLLVALYDGSEGGTHNCVKYANKVKKDVLNVWPLWDKMNENI